MKVRIPAWARTLAVVILGFVVILAMFDKAAAMAADRRGERRSYPMARRIYRRLNPAAVWAIERLGVGAHTGVLRHTGRSSGREYATPLCMVPTSDGYISPASFGPETDWLKNVKVTPESRVVFDRATHETLAEVISLDRAIECNGGTPGCRCWTQGDVEEFVLLRPSEPAVAQKPA